MSSKQWPPATPVRTHSTCGTRWLQAPHGVIWLVKTYLLSLKLISCWLHSSPNTTPEYRDDADDADDSQGQLRARVCAPALYAGLTLWYGRAVLLDHFFG